ncbi:MAG: DUF4954 family protein [Spirochaetales bacterium]|nr:DUF4954 family protein [Spirochaetales bacterium]MCF7937740.1 DUF4954 family protein [Spirochaetales bacterium]
MEPAYGAESDLSSGKAHNQFQEHLLDSPLLRHVSRLKAAVSEGGKPAGSASGAAPSYRPLTTEEIDRLKTQGSHCPDWSRVFAAEDFSPEGIWGSFFDGRCYLGRVRIASSVLSDVLLESGAEVVFSRVSGGGAPAAAARGSSVASGGQAEQLDQAGGDGDSEGAGETAGVPAGDGLGAGGSQVEGETAYGNGIVISPGAETGGREIPLAAGLAFPAASKLILERSGLKARADLEEYRKTVAGLVGKLRWDLSVVGAGARIESAGIVAASYLGPGVAVIGAAEVCDSCLLGPDTSVGAGSIVRFSILEGHAAVDSGALVDRSLLYRGAEAERHAKITESILGFKTVIGEGEVTASLTGPLVGFHHQSLLIAALWPAGRGTLGYGANVGSNHTSRLPDQEIRPGEGMFFGLDSAVKFPADYSRSPYSVIATGVVARPQRLAFPFSLIADPAPQAAAGTAGEAGRARSPASGADAADAADSDSLQAAPGAAAPGSPLPPGTNRLIPAWMLKANLYALWRGRMKFAERTAAHGVSSSPGVKEAADFDPGFLREDIAALVRDAAERLQAAGEAAAEKTGSQVIPDDAIYGPGEVEGMGANYITEKDRKRAVAAYEMYLAWYRCVSVLEGESAGCPESANDREPAASAQTNRSTNLHADLAGYPALLEQLEGLIISSRKKDEKLGTAVFDDYREVHPGIEQDPVVLDFKAYRKEQSEYARRCEEENGDGV